MSKILIISPRTFGYERRIRVAVQELGYEVDWMDERIGNDFFSKAITRLGLLKWLPWIIKKHIREIVERLRDFDADVLLLVNPETINGRELEKIKSDIPTVSLIVYKWDSAYQKPIDERTFSLADRVYSFDPEDCRRNEKLHHLPLFHHYDEPQVHVKGEKKYDFSFVGTAHIHRLKTLAKLETKFEEQNTPSFFYLKTKSRLHQIFFRFAASYYGYKGVLSAEELPYESFLAVIQSSRAIIDIEFPRQSGLTMRSFEVIFSGTPLVTTNMSVKEYDFFSASSIFTFDPKNVEVPSREELVLKDNSHFFDEYSVSQWAKHLLKQKDGMRWDGRLWR